MTEQELNEVRELNRRVIDCERRLQTVRTTVERLTPILDGLPRARAPTSHLEICAAQILDLESELADLRVLLSAAIERLSSRLQEVPLTAREHEVAMMRYVGCMRFRDIQFELNVSDARVFFLHQSAARKILCDR